MKVVITLITIVISINLFAQKEKYGYGYILHKNGTTEQGYIKKTGFDVQFEKIYFKNKSGSEIELLPSDIDGYYVAGKKFASGEVKNEDGTGSIATFFEILVSGDIELLRLFIPSNSTIAFPSYLRYEENHFFLRSSKNQIQLSRDSRKKEIDDFIDCNENVKDGIYDFTRQGLTNYLLAKSDVCNDLKLKAETKISERRGNYSYGFAVGVITSKVIPSHPHFENVDFNSGSGIHLTAFIEIPIAKSLTVRGGFNYLSKKTQGLERIIVSEFYENEGEIISLDTDIEIGFVGVFADLKYQIPTKYVQPYVFAGLNFGISTNSQVNTEELRLLSENGLSYRIKGETNLYDAKPHRYDAGLKYGLGLMTSINKWSLFSEIDFRNNSYKGGTGVLGFDSDSMSIIIGCQIKI